MIHFTNTVLLKMNYENSIENSRIPRLIVLKIFVLILRCSLYLISESQSCSIFYTTRGYPWLLIICILTVATSGLLWLPVTLLPVAATFGYQYKVSVVQGILQLCQMPAGIILYVPLSLPLSSRFKPFFIIPFG